MALIFIPVILCITLSVFLYAERTIEAEFSSINLTNTRSAAEEMKKLTRKMRFITASLLLDDDARAFFTDSDVFEGTERALNGQITSYLNTYEGIESIYLYSPLTGQVLTGLTYYKSTTAAANIRWLNDFQMASGMLLTPRIQEEGYPYVLTAIRRLNEYGYDGVAVVNISLNAIASMLGVQEDDAHSFYILNEAGEVLYRKNKQALLEEKLGHALPISYEDWLKDCHYEKLDKKTTRWLYQQERGFVEGLRDASLKEIARQRIDEFTTTLRKYIL